MGGEGENGKADNEQGDERGSCFPGELFAGAPEDDEQGGGGRADDGFAEEGEDESEEGKGVKGPAAGGGFGGGERADDGCAEEGEDESEEGKGVKGPAAGGVFEGGVGAGIADAFEFEVGPCGEEVKEAGEGVFDFRNPGDGIDLDG